MGAGSKAGARVREQGAAGVARRESCGEKERERRKERGERKRKRKNRKKGGEKEKRKKRGRERERFAPKISAATTTPVKHAQRSRARVDKATGNRSGVGNRTIRIERDSGK